MDFQQQRYMRPPAPPQPQPPSMADQHHYQQPPPPPPPAQPQAPWFSGQFQYQPSQHSPSPPPPHPQWAPPPQSDHLPPPPYPAPPHPPYPVQPIHTHQYPPLPPRPHLPPSHPHSLVPQSYPQVNQEWGNPNWSHHQGWEYPAHNHEEDLAARARAWAAANAATDNQHSQSQFTPVVGRPEEQSHYHSHYPQNIDPHYSDVQQSSLPSSSYQPYPSSVVAPPHRAPIGGHPQESTSFSSGYLPHDARDGNFPGDSNTSFHHRESSSTSLSVHQQEVPSSYSSVAEDAANQTEKFYNSMTLPPSILTPQHYAQPPLPSAGRSLSIEQPHYSFANQSAEPATDLSDQPLDFVPRFPQDHDPHMQPNYTHAWTPPLAPGGVLYPPVDPAAAVPSSVPGHSAPMFGRMPGPGYQSAITSVNTPFGMGAGTTVHPSTVFPVDAYGVSERPKKASVPNWLREEIIKTKPVITSSAPELSKDEAVSFEDEVVDEKSSSNGDQANSKTVDSSRSMEEEDEDYVEAARTAAVNQEIKRVLTEVLLKVTDELFDEIATKVLSEHDDLTVEVKNNGAASVHTLSPSTPAVQTPKASAKVLIPPKAKESHSDDVIEKSTSSSPGDVLGLGNYASDEDEDEDDAIQSSDVPNPKGGNVNQKPNKLLEDTHVHNGSSEAETGKHSKTHMDAESNSVTMSPNKAKVNHNAVVSEASDISAGRESTHGDFRANNADGDKVPDMSDISKSKNGVGYKIESLGAKKSVSDDSENGESRNKRDKNDRSEKRCSSGKEIVKDDDNRKRQDERHARKEKKNDQNGSAEKIKEQSVKSGEKAKDSDSRKRSTHLDAKEDRKDIHRERKASGKESNDRKRERTKDDKGERSRHKYGNDSSRHKRRHSSSGGNDSSDGSSDDSKRKVHSERRKSSSSPVRSRRRQVSRSPHSKHSQRRHSPYSSLETTRGRRPRSRSPVRRER